MNINTLYTDITPELNRAWNNDIERATGVRAVKNSLLGIITTRKGSRPFMPDFGCGLSDMLFENASPLVADTMERDIISAIRNYEPRIDRLAVNVTPIYDSYSIIVSVEFSIIDDPDTIEQIKIKLQSSQ